jgi:hypothetical protein
MTVDTAVISFHLAAVEICTNTSRCSQPQVLTVCNTDVLLVRSNEWRRLVVGRPGVCRKLA